jgi:SAM-dependent methyltransferase
VAVATVYTGKSTRWHDDYDLGRPGWPPEVIELPGLTPSARVAELAAGTGKLTQLLVTGFEDVVAIEPDPGMRRIHAAKYPAVELLAGSAEDIPLIDRSVDAVFVAEAFHLFASEHAVGQTARVLRPGGTLVLMWNLPAGPAEPPIEAAERLLAVRGPDKRAAGYDPADLNPRRYESGEWRQAFAGSSFGEFQQACVPNLQAIDRDGLVAFFASMGWLADLPDAERLPLLAQIRALLPQAEYRRPWQSHVHWTRLADR